MENQFEAHKRLIHKWVDEGKLPGVNHLVVKDGEVLDETVVGFSDVESEVALTTDSLFRLASATKIFVTLLLLRLIDQGRVHYDDKLEKYFPELSTLSVFSGDGAKVEAVNSITVEDVARHSHGFSYGDNEPYRSALISAALLKTDSRLVSDWSHNMTLSDWMAALSNVPMEFESGTAVAYGLGHDMLGALIENLMGAPLDECFRREIIEPLELTSTFFVVPVDRSPDLTSYYFYGKELVRLETGEESKFLERPKSFSGGGGWDMLGNGGLVTNARDFATILQVIVDKGVFKGQRFLKEETISRLTSNRTEGIGEVLPGHGYSYGWGYQKEAAANSGRGGIGKMWWGGSTNPYFFVDPMQNLLSVCLTHTFPFGHLDAAHVLEKMTYKAIES